MPKYLLLAEKLIKILKVLIQNHFRNLNNLIVEIKSYCRH